jgi:hypothetical protein
MSTRAIAAATNTSYGTVNRELAATDPNGSVDAPPPITGVNGKTYQPSKPEALYIFHLYKIHSWIPCLSPQELWMYSAISRGNYKPQRWWDMPNYTNLTDREILLEMVRHRAIAEQAATELMRRANEEPTHNVPEKTQ